MRRKNQPLSFYNGNYIINAHFTHNGLDKGNKKSSNFLNLRQDKIVR